MTPEAGVTTLEQTLDDSTCQLISLGGPRPEVVEEVAISNAADPIVEAVAGRYASRGIFLVHRELRSVAPTKCLEAALEDEEQAVFLIAENRTVVSAESALVSRDHVQLRARDPT